MYVNVWDSMLHVEELIEKLWGGEKDAEVLLYENAYNEVNSNCHSDEVETST